MVDSILAKFELSPDTPAVHYSNAAVALQHKNEKEAKDLLAAAEKNFSPQLNKLFAESLYEVGWLQKPAGQTRAALELTSAADRQAKTKALATEKFEQAEQAFQQRDLTAARKLIDEADAADPNQPATINLRGEILLAQKDFDGAEAAFKQAAKIDPKFREAQYNLAQIPFKKKEYTKARDRFEALFNATPAPGGDKNQASQIIKFKIYLTLLLEGKDSRAQKMMEQFQFTGDTPALYYAQAAWEFKHNNAAKANDWIVSARKIYSPALNMVFADSFYDLGWLQQNVAAAPVTPPKDVAKVDNAPSIEPSPIPNPAIALNKTAPQKSPSNVSGMEATTSNAAQSPPASTALLAKNEKAPAPTTTNSPSVETPNAANALPSETRAPLPREPGKRRSPPRARHRTCDFQRSHATEPSHFSGEQSCSACDDDYHHVRCATKSGDQPPTSPANKVAPATSVASTPATVLAPANIQESAVSESTNRFDTRMVLAWVAGALGGLILLWVVFSEIRRRVGVPVYRSPAPATGPSFEPVPRETPVEKMAAPARIAGGPPQVSLHLKASEPSVRRAAVPFGKTSRPFGANGGSNAVAAAAAVEDFVPRTSVPVEEPEQAEAPASISDYAVEAPSKPQVEDDWDFSPAPVSAPVSEFHEEFSSVSEPQVIEEPAQIIESLDEIPAAQEEPAFVEAPAWTEPVTSEPEWAPVSFEPSAPVFETPAPRRRNCRAIRGNSGLGRIGQ